MEGDRGHNDIFYVLLAICQVFYAIHIYQVLLTRIQKVISTIETSLLIILLLFVIPSNNLCYPYMNHMLCRIFIVHRPCTLQ